KIFINTSGIGIVDENLDISSTRGRPGDNVILSGTMGDHGITIMTRRAGISLQGRLESDTMALHTMVAKLVAEVGDGVHTMRDPTRGGVATSLNEIAASCKLSIELKEEDLPVTPEVRTACEILGLEPLYLANEGKCLVIVSAEQTQQALAVMHGCREGAQAQVIGRLIEGPPGRVVINTPIGGSRIVTPLHGEPLPRIC
ncbi:MAG TPA: AIR synthase-related protein, partial [Desulfopila sp.]|nr:AIR synthase-related protein [Desulfopila sp.]